MTDRDRRDPEEGGDRSSSDRDSTELEDWEDDQFADLTELREDDALLDALGGTDSVAVHTPGGAELDELLLAWRRDIDSEPMAELVDTETAVTTIQSASLSEKRRRRGRRRRAVVPVAVAAAVLAIAFTGTGLAARSAEPGDALWGLSKVLYTEHAQSVQAAASVRVDLEQADAAISHGRIHRARQALESAAEDLSKVAPEDNLNQLRAQHDKLTSELGGPGNGSDSTGNTSLPGESTTGSTETSTPDESTSTSPRETEIPPEETSTSPPETSSSTSTPSSSPSPSPSTSQDDSGSSPKVDTSGDESPAAPAG